MEINDMDHSIAVWGDSFSILDCMIPTLMVVNCTEIGKVIHIS